MDRNDYHADITGASFLHHFEHVIIPALNDQRDKNGDGRGFAIWMDNAKYHTQTTYSKSFSAFTVPMLKEYMYIMRCKGWETWPEDMSSEAAVLKSLGKKLLHQYPLETKVEEIALQHGHEVYGFYQHHDMILTPLRTCGPV